jgi:hypothetical protein
MTSSGTRMEVLAETRLGDQAHKIIIQPLGQLFMSVHLQPTRHEPGGVQPARTAPVTPRLMAYVGQINARDA